MEEWGAGLVLADARLDSWEDKVRVGEVNNPHWDVLLMNYIPVRVTGM